MKENEYEDMRKIEDGEDRALSALLREANGDAPQKDGVSLHDAVMARVESGDTAPRYIPARSFRFPVATAACLALFLVAVFVTKSGLLTRFGNKSADSAAPEACQLTTNAKEPTEEKQTGGAFLSDAAFGAMPSASEGGAVEVETEEAEEAVVTNEADAGEAVAQAKADVSTDAGEQNGAILKESKRAVTSTAASGADAAAEGGAAPTSVPEDNASEQREICDGVPLVEASEPDSEETVEESAVQNDADGAGAPAAYAVRAGGSSSEKSSFGDSPTLSVGAIERMKKAAEMLAEYGAENVEPIRAETIAAHGDAAYCAFFDAIADRGSFALLYTEEIYIIYCKKGEAALENYG